MVAAINYRTKMIAVVASRLTSVRLRSAEGPQCS